MCWPRGETIDRFFLYFASSFIHKNIVTPGGYVFKVSKSVPSGSCWTTIIDSLVNWIVWCDVITNYPVFKRRGLTMNDVVLRIGGDDFLLGFKKDVTFSVTKLRFWILKRHGMSLKASSGLRVLVSSDESRCASFYKCILKDGMPNIRTVDLYETLVVPSTSLAPTFEFCKYVASRVQAPPGDTTTVEILSSLFAYLKALHDIVVAEAPHLEPFVRTWDRSWHAPPELEVLLSRFINTRHTAEHVTSAIAEQRRWLSRRWAELFVVTEGLHGPNVVPKITESTRLAQTGASGITHRIREARALRAGAHAPPAAAAGTRPAPYPPPA
jgi:hypothetical protein